MRITFYSNFMNHHQEKLSLKLYELTNGKYNFVACTPIEKERIELGYEDMNKKYDFIIRPYENDKQHEKAKQLAIESDVIIFGSADKEYLNLRMLYNKLTFIYSERLFKKGIYRRFVPRTRKKIYNGYVKYKDKNLYVLCSSAYTSYDLSLCGFPKEKCFKWGYFPDIDIPDIDNILDEKNSREIVWVGRFINWKHPEVVVKVADKLRRKNKRFHVTMIGNGIDFTKIKHLIERKKLESYITLTGSIPYEDVNEYMKKASIFLFTSDFQEGWGAVLNEAMSCGCACVASHAIGSVAYLIKHKHNGYIYRYKNHNIDEICEYVKELLENKELCITFGKNASHTIANEWNYDVAATKLIKLSEGLLNKKPITETEGICSFAQKYINNWL